MSKRRTKPEDEITAAEARSLVEDFATESEEEAIVLATILYRSLVAEVRKAATEGRTCYFVTHNSSGIIGMLARWFTKQGFVCRAVGNSMMIYW